MDGLLILSLPDCGRCTHSPNAHLDKTRTMYGRCDTGGCSCQWYVTPIPTPREPED